MAQRKILTTPAISYVRAAGQLAILTLGKDVTQEFLVYHEEAAPCC